MDSKAYNKSELRVFRLNTGNINSCGELKRRACKDSAEELVAALQIELNKRDDLHFALVISYFSIFRHFLLNRLDKLEKAFTKCAFK